MPGRGGLIARRRRGPSAALERKLAAISALADAPEDAARPALAKALADRSSHAVARAAELIGRRRLPGLEDALAEALARLSVDPVKRDPGCAGKRAILEALDALDHPDPAPFLAAARHVQMEPSWGPPVDTAAPLRARAALAIGRTYGDDSLLALGELLGDPEPPVRRAAIQALQERGDRAGAALLALRFRAGDGDPVALLECMIALVKLAPAWAVGLLAPALDGTDPERRELAALALGESRQPAALDALAAWLDRLVLAEERAMALNAIAAHRSERARQILLDQIAEGSPFAVQQVLGVLIAQGLSEPERAAIREALARHPDDLSGMLAAAERGLL